MINKVKKIKKKYIVLFLSFVLLLITPFTYSKYISKYTKHIIISAIQSGYMVKFDANGGDGEMTVQSFKYGTPQKLNENKFTKEDYVFLNWNTASDGTGTSYGNQEEVNNLTTENGGIVTLYAIYAREKYIHTGDITFDGENGTNPYFNTEIYLFSEKNINKDFEVSFEIKSRGENTSYTSGNYPTIMSAMDESGEPWPGMVYRQFDEGHDQIAVNASSSNSYNEHGYNFTNIKKVTLKRINGVIYLIINDEPEVELLDASLMARTFNFPVVFGASFNKNMEPQRWFRGTLSNLKVVVTEPNTNIGTIKYNPNGGEGNNFAQHISPDTTYKLRKNTYTREGYLFDGWISEDGTTYQDEAEVTLTSGQVLKLSAKWKEYKYTVNFDANGGNGEMASQEFRGGTSEPLDKSLFTRDDGLTFAFWNTKANGSGITYQDEQIVDNLSANTDSVTLYAIYEQFSFEQAGPTTFDGIDDYIDTHIYLFSEKNVNKNFEISFEITSYENTHKYNTFISSLDESDKPYPGFVFRINDSPYEYVDSTLDYNFEANSSSSRESNNMYPLEKEIKKVVIKRFNGVLYFKRDDNAEEQIIDYAKLARKFYYPVTIGASLDNEFNPWRHFKGIISDLNITLGSSESTGE